MSNAVYLGRIPEGFVEKDMMKYFAQFGHIERLKMFRSPKTGRSRGFAFIEFANAQVAKIVASTMNNYLMFEKIMKCHVVPEEKLHDRMFLAWRKLPKPSTRLRRTLSKVNGPRGDKQHEKMLRRLAKKITQQNKKLADAGINYSFPVTWAKSIPEVHVKDDLSDVDQDQDVDLDQSANDSKITASEYSMLIDSSEDEIVFRTPEKCVKKSKSLTTRAPSANSNEKTKKNVSALHKTDHVILKSILKRKQ